MATLSKAPVVDAGHRGPLLNVAKWVVLAPTCIAAIVKLYTKWALLRRLQVDDALTLTALLFAIAQSVATTKQVHFGLGKHQNDLTNADINNFSLARYVGRLFYLLTIYTFKTVGLWFFLNLIVDPRTWKAIIHSLLAFILVT